MSAFLHPKWETILKGTSHYECTLNKRQNTLQRNYTPFGESSHIPQFPSQRSVTKSTEEGGKLKTSPALIDELISIIYPEPACGGGLHL